MSFDSGNKFAQKRTGLCVRPVLVRAYSLAFVIKAPELLRVEFFDFVALENLSPLTRLSFPLTGATKVTSYRAHASPFVDASFIQVRLNHCKNLLDSAVVRGHGGGVDLFAGDHETKKRRA